MYFPDCFFQECINVFAPLSFKSKTLMFQSLYKMRLHISKRPCLVTVWSSETLITLSLIIMQQYYRAQLRHQLSPSASQSSLSFGFAAISTSNFSRFPPRVSAGGPEKHPFIFSSFLCQSKTKKTERDEIHLIGKKKRKIDFFSTSVKSATTCVTKRNKHAKH